MAFPLSGVTPLPDDRSARNVLLASGTVDPSVSETELRLEDGRVVRIATSSLLDTRDSGGSFADVSRERGDAGTGNLVVPVAEEQLVVGRRLVETGTVRLRKVVQEYETKLDEVLAIRTFDVERVVLNRPVETAPEVRQEGDTTVYPLVEERLVVTRELVLKEELRVTRRDTERRDERPVTLRRETVEVEREAVSGVGTGADGASLSSPVD